MSNEKSMSSVISDIEALFSRIEVVKDLIQVLSEGLEREVAMINSNEPWTVELFVKRYGILESQLCAIFILICDVIDDAREPVNAGYKILKDKKNKEGSTV